MLDFAAVETAYKNADWAEVIDLLDDHFGKDLTPNYSVLKQTINNALIQGEQPKTATQQALKMLINELKKAAPKEGEELYNYQQRAKNIIAKDSKQETFYRHLLKFDYHAKREDFFNHLRQKSFKANVLVVVGNSKAIDTMLPFDLFAQHFLFDAINRTANTQTNKLETKFSNSELGWTYTQQAYFSLAGSFMQQMLNSGYYNKQNTSWSIHDIYTKSENQVKDLFFDVVKDRLKDCSLILPYRIPESVSIDKGYEIANKFIDSYWSALVSDINQNAELYKFRSLILLIVIDHKNSNPTLSEVVDLSNIDTEEIPEKIKIQLQSDYELCKKWSKKDGFFLDGEEDCGCFPDNLKYHKENYLPDCKTIEGLLEKITADTFPPEVTLFQILKNHKIAR